MSNTSNLVLPYLAVGQAQKHVTVNESLRKLDAIIQLSVVSATTAAQPASPTDGAVYIVPSGKSGAQWSAFANWALAYYRDGAWVEIPPREGWLAFVKDTDTILAFNGSTWSRVAPDYEEGSWTPAFTFATPGNLSISATLATGAYVRIGKLVHVAFSYVSSAFTHSTASGTARLTGLPFANGGVQWVGQVAYNGITKAGYTDVASRILGSNQYVDFLISGSGQTVAGVSASDMPSGGTVTLVGSLSYTKA